MTLPYRSQLRMHPNVNELKCGCGPMPNQVVTSPMDQPQVRMLADHSRRFFSPAFSRRGQSIGGQIFCWPEHRVVSSYLLKASR